MLERVGYLVSKLRSGSDWGQSSSVSRLEDVLIGVRFGVAWYVGPIGVRFGVDETTLRLV